MKYPFDLVTLSDMCISYTPIFLSETPVICWLSQQSAGWIYLFEVIQKLLVIQNNQIINVSTAEIK